MLKFSQELLSKIKDCSNQEMIDEAFGDMKPKDKVDALLETMGNPIVFYSYGELSLERQYKALSGSLLSGAWRDDYSSYEAIRKKAERKEKERQKEVVC
jgi:hypothetical protein